MKTSLTIKQEYFKLVKKLNLTNINKNQVTNIYFYIDSVPGNHLKLFAAVSETQKILLNEKIGTKAWVQANTTSFIELEVFLSELLNKVKIENDLTSLIKSHIFKHD